MLDSINIAFDHLHEGDLSGVNKELENVKASLNKRKKVIRFADKSPAGWATVEEYESDELADDSEDKKKLRSAERGRSPRFACVNSLEVLARPANFRRTVMALWAPEVLQIALLLSLFATSHLLNSRFGRIGVLEHHSLPTNASPAGSLGTGQTRLSVLATAVPTATRPCQGCV